MTHSDLGAQGEALTATHLQAQGWQILAQGWHCRGGELDVVAQRHDWLIFVEVKTRQSSTLDGLLAVSPTKQRRLIRAAQVFLQVHPQWADCSCRFDVAVVLALPRLHVATYLEAAFSLDG